MTEPVISNSSSDGVIKWTIAWCCTQEHPVKIADAIGIQSLMGYTDHKTSIGATVAVMIEVTRQKPDVHRKQTQQLEKPLYKRWPCTPARSVIHVVPSLLLDSLKFSRWIHQNHKE